MDIFSLVILFFVISTVVRLVKKVAAPAKKSASMTQEQIEATTHTQDLKPAPKPAPKPNDFRFPTVAKQVSAPTFQEGPDPNVMRREYTPINTSIDLDTQFSAYEGSLDVTETEGVGYEAESFDDSELISYSTSGSDVQILPESFNRDALLQAVVMSEVLKRPGARR